MTGMILVCFTVIVFLYYRIYVKLKFTKKKKSFYKSLFNISKVMTLKFPSYFTFPNAFVLGVTSIKK